MPSSENIFWSAYSELSAIRHGRPMSAHREVDELLAVLEREAKKVDAARTAGTAAPTPPAAGAEPPLPFVTRNDAERFIKKHLTSAVWEGDTLMVTFAYEKLIFALVEQLDSPTVAERMS
jgi:hypothetical protein